MDTPSRKRRVINLDLKKKIIDASAGKKSEDLSKIFGLTASSIRNILADKTAILKAIDEGGEAKRARFVPVKHEDVEKGLLSWFREVRSENVSLTGPFLAEKARELAKELAKPIKEALQHKQRPLRGSEAELEKKMDELERFKASDGCLSGFKHRHSIFFKGNQGEAADIDMQDLKKWQEGVLREALSHFSSDDIFNADETGLFWKLLPNKTLIFKGANMSGSEKLPLLVIGKSEKPRAFKNKEVPVAYKSNRKAWITADIFKIWLKELDQKLKREKENVLLFLDNFSGHPNIKLQNITIKFLLPNTTATSQPCDEGIIENLKVLYKRFLLRDRIAAIDAKANFKMDLFNALKLLQRSWSYVKPSTIANCFRNAGFVKDVEPMDQSRALEEEEQPVVGNSELYILWAELQKMDLVEGTLDQYLAVDDQLTIGGTRTLAEIAEDVLTTKLEESKVESDTEEIEINEEPETPVTTRETTAALKIFQRYVEQNFNDPSLLQMCYSLDDALAKERVKKLKQKNLLDYFTNTD